METPQSVPHALLDWKCFPRGNPSWRTSDVFDLLVA
jgi:hypothetical protein